MNAATIEAARVAYCEALGLHPDGVLFAKVRRNRIGRTFDVDRVVVVGIDADGTVLLHMAYPLEGGE